VLRDTESQAVGQQHFEHGDAGLSRRGVGRLHLEWDEDRQSVGLGWCRRALRPGGAAGLGLLIAELELAFPGPERVQWQLLPLTELHGGESGARKAFERLPPELLFVPITRSAEGCHKASPEKDTGESIPGEANNRGKDGVYRTLTHAVLQEKTWH
jgi:hypothetical protein